MLQTVIMTNNILLWMWFCLRTNHTLVLSYYNGGVRIQGKTGLHIFQNGPVTGVRYRDEILDPNVRSCHGAVRPVFILLDDNATPHRARSVDQCLEAEAIEHLDWPAQFPNLNSVEHIWDMVGRAVRDRTFQSRTFQELRDALQQEWARISQQRIRNIICSMRMHGHDVIRTRRGNTYY